MGIKKTEFDADLESVEKVAKSLQMESFFVHKYYCIVKGEKKSITFFFFKLSTDLN
jgi:hypothetical protein